jgi:predicted Zn-ribbon and HTH transcriptional regulator
VKEQKRKTKLSEGNVEKVFAESGFTVVKINPLAAMPKFPTNAREYTKNLDTLQKMKNPNPNGPDFARIVDLYTFIAYLNDDFGNARLYKDKSTAELKAAFDKQATMVAQRDGDLGELLKKITGFGKTNVFDKEENHRNYEAYLKYTGAELAELFAAIKRSSASDLKDSKFAAMCIKQISAVFPGEAALAIYNNEAGLRNDPYIPEKVSFTLKCAHCQNFVEFSDVAESRKTNECSQCHGKLYKTCKNAKCGNFVLVQHNKCSECGYVFADAAVFNKHMTVAEEALRRCDFHEAFRALTEAKIADPAAKAKTAELEGRIIAAETKYKAPIDELRKLIAEQKYMTAKESLAVITSRFANINVASYENLINLKLSGIKVLFDEAKNESDSESECADACVVILDECVDYKPAIDFLKATSPVAVPSVSVAGDTVSWERSEEQGIRYRVVRKTGSVAPANALDGDVIAESTTDTVFRDTTVQSGLRYSYSVFAERMGVYSAPKSASLLLVADIDGLRYEQIDKTVSISWNIPQNCTGVTVTRFCEGQQKSEIASTAYVDNDIEYGKMYTYKLQANYLNDALNALDMPSSSGVSFNIMPSLRIEAFGISSAKIADGKYKISYDIKSRDIDIRVTVNGKLMRTLKSDNGFCELELPAGGHYNVEVSALSGGEWLNSRNTLQINTFSSCEIDKVNSVIEEKPSGTKLNTEVRIRLGEIPNHVSAFLYCVRTKSAENKWLAADEVETAPDVRKITAEEYRKKGEIVYSCVAGNEDSYYVTLYTLYSVNGQEIMSSECKRRLERPLNANIFWRVTKSMLGKPKLSVEVKPNRPIAAMPRLILCVSSNDRKVISHSAANSVKVQTFESVETEQPLDSINLDLEITEGKLAKKQNVFLFVDNPNGNQKFTLRWANGFEGRI